MQALNYCLGYTRQNNYASNSQEQTSSYYASTSISANIVNSGKQEKMDLCISALQIKEQQLVEEIKDIEILDDQQYQKYYEQMLEIQKEDEMYISDINQLLYLRKLYDAKEAHQHFKEFQKFKARFRVRSINEIQDEIDHRKVFFCGHDKQGHVALVGKVIRNVSDSCPVETRVKYVFYLLNQVMLRCFYQDTKAVFIWERKGFVKSKHYDQRTAKFMEKHRSMLENNFYGRIDKIHILNMDWFFRWIIFPLAKSFMKAKTISKINLLGNNYQALLDYFDKDQLLEEFGGSLVESELQGRVYY